MLKKIQAQTLIESLVTLLLVAFAILALLRLQGYLGYDNNFIQQKADALALAFKTTETVRDYHVYNNTSGYTSYQSIATGTSTVTGSTATYTVTWTVTAYTNPTYKNINVTVAWTDKTGTAQSVQLVTHVTGVEPSNSSSIM